MIGTQAHLNLSTTYEIMDDSLAEIRKLGLPIHVTELDVNTATRGQRGTGADISNNSTTTQGGLVDESAFKQAVVYAGVFKAFVNHSDVIKLVTFWGVNDAVSWRRLGNPLLFDGDNQPKPAFDAVVGVVRGGK